MCCKCRKRKCDRLLKPPQVVINMTINQGSNEKRGKEDVIIKVENCSSENRVQLMSKL